MSVIEVKFNFEKSGILKLFVFNAVTKWNYQEKYNCDSEQNLKKCTLIQMIFDIAIRFASNAEKLVGIDEKNQLCANNFDSSPKRRKKIICFSLLIWIDSYALYERKNHL